MKQLHHEDLLNINEDFKTLTQLITEEKSPLTLCQDVNTLLKRIVDHDPDLAVYEDHVRKSVVRQLLISVAKMYSSISIDRLQKMFFDGWTARQIEDLILQMVEEGFIWCRMSHRDNMCYFRAPDRLERDSFMQKYLANLADKLNTLYDRELAREHSARNKFFDNVRHGVQDDDRKIVVRHAKIIQTSKLANRKQGMQKWLKNQTKMQNKWTAQDALRKETERIHQLKIQEKKKRAVEQQKERQAKEAARVAKLQLKKVQKVVGADLVSDKKKKKLDLLFKDNEPTTKEAIEAVTVNYLQSIKDAQEEKKLNELKFQDYFVRACRLEEIPKLHKQYRKEAEQKQEEIQVAYESEVEKQRDSHEAAVKLKKVFLQSQKQGHVNLFQQRLEARREEQYQRAKNIQDEQKRQWEERQEKQKRQQQSKREQQQNDYKRKQEAQLKAQEERVAQQQEAQRRAAERAADQRESQQQQQQAPPVRRQPTPQQAPPRGRFQDDNQAPVRRTAPETAPPTASAGGGWNTIGTRRGRPKFTNSKKSEQVAARDRQEAERTQQPARPAPPARQTQGGWRNRQQQPEAGQAGGSIRAPAPATRNIRPAAPKTQSIRRAAPTQTQGGAPRKTRGNFAPLEPTPQRTLRRTNQAGERPLRGDPTRGGPNQQSMRAGRTQMRSGNPRQGR